MGNPEISDWYTQATKQGNVDAMGQLADYYYENGNLDQALYWNRRGALRGDQVSQHNMGKHFEFDLPKPNYRRAAHWYRLAADQGYPAAKTYLAGLYCNGKGVRKDYGEALRLYREAAVAGDAMAMNDLGCMYADGEGVARDYAESLRLFRRAAQHGYEAAMYNLGIAYLNGEGVAANRRTARYWLRRAAALDYQDAINELETLNNKQ